MAPLGLYMTSDILIWHTEENVCELYRLLVYAPSALQVCRLAVVETMAQLFKINDIVS